MLRVTVYTAAEVARVVNRMMMKTLFSILSKKRLFVVCIRNFPPEGDGMIRRLSGGIHAEERIPKNKKYGVPMGWNEFSYNTIEI